MGASELQKLVSNYIAMPAHIKDKLGKVLPRS